MKKICLQFSLALLCLISVFGLAGKSAKAMITGDGSSFYYRKNADDGSGNFSLTNTISATCANPILIATVVEYQGPYNFDNITYDGVAMTADSTGEKNYIQGAGSITYQSFYLVGPALGTKSFHARWTRGAGSDPMTIYLRSFCGVDQTNPIDSVIWKTQGWSTSALSSGYFAITNNDSAVIAQAVNYWQTNAPTNWTYTTGYNATNTALFYNCSAGGCSGSQFSNLSVPAKTLGDNYSIFYNHSNNSYKDLNVWVLNKYIAPSGTVYTFGYPYLWSLNNSIFNKNETKKFIVSWNTCDIYGEFDHAKIFASLNGELIGQGGPYDYIGVEVIYPELIGPQKCSGIITYFSNPYLTLDTSDSGTIKFYLKTYDASNTVLSTAESNQLTYTTKTGTTFIDNLMENPLMIDLGSLPMGIQTATTTTLFFKYNFKGENSASTTVYLWDYVNATSTGYYTTGPFSSTGDSFWSITIPTPATSTSKLYRFLAVRPGYTYLQSEVFTVNWSFTPGGVAGQTCSPPSYDFSHTCDDIENATSTLFGQLKCSIKFGLGVAGVALFSPSCDSLYSFQNNFNSFKESFPFNTFYEFIDTIDAAIDTSLATTTGNTFSVPFIRKTATSSEYYAIPVISTSTYPKIIGQSNYNIIRLAEEYIYWILAAVLVYFIIIKKKI